jgi:hypothetical protein
MTRRRPRTLEVTDQTPDGSDATMTDDSDDTREIDLAAVELAYAEATTEARIQREQEAEMARRDLWAVGD